jgi:hypothetical protein
VAFSFLDWVDWTGIGFTLFLIICAALVWMWWIDRDRHRNE